MSSSSDDAALERPRWRDLLRGGSIANHIARLYTLSAVVLLGIVVGLLYWVESESLELDDVYFLTDKVQELRSVLQKHPTEARFLEHEVKHQGGIYALGQKYVFYSRILDEAGNVLLESRDAGAILPPSAFPAPIAEEQIPEAARLIRGADGKHYLVIAAWARTGGAQSERRQLQVALDDSVEREFIGKYRRDSLLLVFFGILFSARIAVLIARSSMRPLRKIARVAEEITASQLHHRLQVESWPTELVALARAFDGMLGRLDDSHTRLAQFSADLAHELRTPIQVLMGQTEVALNKPRRAEDYRHVLESNLEEFHRLARMINGLLFIARAEDPKVQIQASRLDARRELEAIREFHEALSEDHGVIVSCEGDAEIHADPLLLRRAITNLLSNALRHTPCGGAIVLAAVPQDGGTAVKVTDTGCGIRPEDLPKVGERLYSANRHKANCSAGLGLGFAIVKSIAELHGGHVSIVSTPDVGTTVSVYFPNAAERQPPARVPDAEAAPPAVEAAPAPLRVAA